MGGLMSITGEKDELPGGGPQKVGVAVTDVFTGLYATIAIQGALLERERSGLGQHIDLALFDVQAAVLANQATNYLVGGVVPQRLGNAHPNIVPYQAFATADDFMILAIGNDRQFKAFCEVAGAWELAADPRFATNPERVKNRTAVCDAVAKLLKQHKRDYWLETLEEHSVPCGPINSIDQVFNDPQLLERGMRISQHHPQAGEVDLVGNPIHYSRTPVQQDKAPPMLGEHSETILETVLGYSEEKIQTLKENGCL